MPVWIRDDEGYRCSECTAEESYCDDDIIDHFGRVHAVREQKILSDGTGAMRFEADEHAAAYVQATKHQRNADDVYFLWGGPGWYVWQRTFEHFPRGADVKVVDRLVVPAQVIRDLEGEIAEHERKIARLKARIEVFR